MSKVRICDFCGKVIDEGSKNVKLKVRNNTKKYFEKWDHLDVCENCANWLALCCTKRREKEGD